MENLNAEQVTNPNIELYDYVKRIVAAVKYKGEGDHEDVPSILRKFAKGYEQRITEARTESERLKARTVEALTEFAESVKRYYSALPGATVGAAVRFYVDEKLKEALDKI